MMLTKKPNLWKRSAVAVACLAILPASIAHAAGTAEQKCEGGKNDAAGKYAACCTKAEKAYLSTGDAAKYGASLSKCEGKLVSSWTKLENGAVAAGTTCPSVGDQVSIQDFVDACVQSVSSSLAGNPPLLDVVTCNDDLATCDGDLASCGGDLASCSTDLDACYDDYAICNAAPAAQVSKTGQTNCYTAAGAAQACTGTRQDGDLQPGIARSFTDNGDGTITDNSTGLMWEKFSDDSTIHDRNNQYTWANAFAVKLANLNTNVFAGHNDWRVPTVSEMASLSRFASVSPAEYTTFTTPCSAGCTVTTCSCSYPAAFWSSTSDAGTPSKAWTWNADTGGLGTLAKTATQNVRAVRNATVPPRPAARPLRTGQSTCSDVSGATIACAGSGQDAEFLQGAANLFIDNGDGTITHDSTGLTWEKLSDDGGIHDRNNTYDWEDAVVTKIATLNMTSFAGHNDWRLPNRNELMTLVDLDEAAPATFPPFDDSCVPSCTVAICSCTPATNFWSSSSYQDATSFAWYVSFDHGGSFVASKTGLAVVRAVRGGS